MKKFQGIVIFLVTSIAFMSPVASHDGATGIVKQRMDAMEDIGTQMKKIAPIVKGEATYDKALLAQAAASIAAHARNIPQLFPEGSLQMPTRADKKIWSDWDGFLKQVKELEARANNLNAAALASSDAGALGQPFGQLVKSCKACHEQYRIPK